MRAKPPKTPETGIKDGIARLIDALDRDDKEAGKKAAIDIAIGFTNLAERFVEAVERIARK